MLSKKRIMFESFQEENWDLYKDVEPFKYSEGDLKGTTKHWDEKEHSLSQFDKVLRGKWDDSMKAGHFRYHLDKVETTVIPGDKRYVAQLNVKRATERRKPQDISLVNQPFNPDLFNFSRIKPAEVMFLLDKEMPTCGHVAKEVPNCGHVAKEVPNCGHVNKEVPNYSHTGTEDVVCNGIQDRKPENLVIINISPLEYGHVLLVPDVYAFRPQMLTEYAIQLAIETILLSEHQGFRVGFNSLCAFASVNHQHLHAYYLEQELFVESCPANHLKGIIHELDVMPAKGFAFQLHGSTVDEVSRVVYMVTDYLQKSEVAHNLFMTRGVAFGEDRTSSNRTVRLFLWPRKKFIGVKEETAFNVAVVELAGHLPIKVADLYKGLTEESIDATIRETALEESEYQQIKDAILRLYQPRETTS